jgi:hypothetical protein
MPDPQADIVVRPSGMMTDTRSPKFRMSTLNEFRLEGDDRTVWILYAVLPHMALAVYVRNKRPANQAHFDAVHTLVFVHGATYPASTAFDLELNRMSWMDKVDPENETGI